MRMLFLLLTLTAILSAQTPTDSHRAAALDMLEASQSEQMMDQVYAQLDNMFAGMVTQMDIPEEKKPVMESYMKKMANLMREEMSWSKWKESFVEIYVNVYTEEELRELAEFYRSPLGEKFMAKMPEVMQETMKVSQQLTMDFMPKMQELQQELVEEIKAGSANEGE